MANIDEALMTYLLTQTAITAVVDRRIYFDTAPQNTKMPFAVVIDISNVYDHGLGGQVTLESPIKQLTIYAATKTQAKSLIALVKTALKDYAGTMSGLEVQWIKIINEFSSVENILEDVTAYIADIEFEIKYVNS